MYNSFLTFCLISEADLKALFLCVGMLKKKIFAIWAGYQDQPTCHNHEIWPTKRHSKFGPIPGPANITKSTTGPAVTVVLSPLLPNRDSPISPSPLRTRTRGGRRLMATRRRASSTGAHQRGQTGGGGRTGEDPRRCGTMAGLICSASPANFFLVHSCLILPP